jgi:hypothetical protein
MGGASDNMFVECTISTNLVQFVHSTVHPAGAASRSEQNGRNNHGDNDLGTSGDGHHLESFWFLRVRCRQNVILLTCAYACDRM